MTAAGCGHRRCGNSGIFDYAQVWVITYISLEVGMRKINAPIVITLVSTFMTSQIQAAATVLDQQAPAADPVAFTFALGGESGQVLYQSLTVGLNGRLAELRLPIGCESGEVILQVFDANSEGLPIAGADARLTRRFAADSFPEVVSTEFQSLRLGGRVGVSAGEQIVIVLSNPTGSCGIAYGVNGDGYTGGTGHADDTTDTAPPVPLNLSPGSPDDLPFQTWVRLTGPRSA
jgi:hypothetical protein